MYAVSNIKNKMTKYQVNKTELLNSILLTIMMILYGHIASSQDSLSQNLTPIEIRQERSYSPQEIKISRTQFLSFPAAYDDPSRLLIKYPGFSTNNDQNNSIVYQGMPSHMSSWSIYGAQILSPNHLSEAGTFSFRPNRSAGGVSMISGQAIGNLEYYLSGEHPSYTLAGVSDISLRQPYSNTITTNLSLIGLEAGIDRVSDNQSFTCNYRYSTVGLLSNLGLNFEGESIKYQDFIGEYRYHINDTEIKMMAVYGKSSNHHEKQLEVPTEEATIKDLKNIFFDANNFVTALNVKDSSFTFTATYSLRDEKKNIDFNYQNQEVIRQSKAKEHLFSTYLNKSFELGLINFDLGATSLYYNAVVSSTDNLNYISNLDAYTRAIEFIDDYWVTRLLTNISYDITPSWIVNGGLHLMKETYSENLFYLPHAKLSYKNSNFTTSVSLSKKQQMQDAEVYGMFGILDFDSPTSIQLPFSNAEIQPTSIWDLSADLSLKNTGINLFAKRIENLPINSSGHFVGLDDLNKLEIIELGNDGEVDIIGASLYTQYTFNGYHLYGNATATQSSFENKDKLSNVKIPLDPTIVYNIRLDKTYSIDDTKHIRLGVSYHDRGGTRENEIDIDASQTYLKTIYSDTGEPYNIRLRRYSRLDLRLSLISQKKKYRSVISLDIQNVLNKENDSYHYYDPLLESVQLQKQLGMIPIISWRVVI